MPHARLRSNKAVNAAAEINFWRPYFIVATHAVPFAGSNCREKTDDLMRFIVASHLVGARAIPIAAIYRWRKFEMEVSAAGAASSLKRARRVRSRSSR